MGIIRKTKSVAHILNIFEKSQEAKSATELVEHFKDEMNKTTVYRILERLEDEGVLHSFKGLEGLQWYARCHGCSTSHHADVHPHFQCTDCGKTECLSQELSLPVVTSHNVQRAELLLIGQCMDCAS